MSFSTTAALPTATACVSDSRPLTNARRVLVAVPCASTPKRTAVAMNSGRREALFAGVVGMGMVAIAQPSQAFLGFGKSSEERYQEDTAAIIALVRENLALKPGDAGREESIMKVRQDTNTWVAKYRRDASVGGKPSYSQTYTALNALAGHYNNFGTKYPLPKKRADRVLKELAFAERALSLGR
eukprot:scaffold4129_cov390-Prasinococcus_capsulatus_cf.AAC.2